MIATSSFHVLGGAKVVGLMVAFAAMFTAMASAVWAGVPSGFQTRIIAQKLKRPTAMAIAPDDRILITEQAGAVRIVKNRKLLATPLLNLTRNVDDRGERGLLGIAFDPAFQTNRWIYVYYTAKKPQIHNRVSRFTVIGNRAIPRSEKILVDIEPLSNATNHNGGAIHFGQDGKLYIAVGDNAFGANSQSLNTLKGKLLRLNKDGSIPQDNPFYKRTIGKNRAIWALGLRNPFTFAVQPNTGRIHINDVGLDTWEEINLGIKGANYGWPQVEGPKSNPRFRKPIFAYGHGSGTQRGCAIVGAAFYNPTTVQFPSKYQGDYFFGDFCNGWIRHYHLGTNYYLSTKRTTLFATGLNGLVDIQVAPNGTLYYLETNWDWSKGRLTAVTHR
ncbi:MAG: PQQ-dependent sugar dehydrogenase [Gloeobacterales cyanobacterium]